MTQARDTLRRSLRRQRRELPAAVRVAAAERLADRLLALPFAPTRGAVAGYWAMDGEIALHAWQLRLPPTLTYCLPVLGDDGRLLFAPWNPGEPLVANRFGIPEPEADARSLLQAADLALAIVPLVGFDAGCNRLGMGGGWYDRSFAFLNVDGSAPPPWLVGAGFAVQQVEAIASEPWDVPLHAVCTEARTFMAGAT